MKTMLDSLRLVTALHPRVDYCLRVDTIQVLPRGIGIFLDISPRNASKAQDIYQLSTSRIQFLLHHLLLNHLYSTQPTNSCKHHPSIHHPPPCWPFGPSHPVLVGRFLLGLQSCQNFVGREAGWVNGTAADARAADRGSWTNEGWKCGWKLKRIKKYNNSIKGLTCNLRTQTWSTTTLETTNPSSFWPTFPSTKTIQNRTFHLAAFNDTIRWAEVELSVPFQRSWICSLVLPTKVSFVPLAIFYWSKDTPKVSAKWKCLIPNLSYFGNKAL